MLCFSYFHFDIFTILFDSQQLIWEIISFPSINLWISFCFTCSWSIRLKFSMIFNKLTNEWFIWIYLNKFPCTRFLHFLHKVKASITVYPYFRIIYAISKAALRLIPEKQWINILVRTLFFSKNSKVGLKKVTSYCSRTSSIGK